jgi:TPR repeat protein
MREDHPASRSSDLPQWIFVGALMSLILLAASSGPAKSSEANQSSNPPQPATSPKPDPDAQLTPLQALQRRVEAGDPEAQRLMALRYRDGDGVLRSAEETMRLLGASARGGDLQSTYELACIYDAGIPGVRSQPDIAWKLFNDAALAGHVDAMWYLSESYLRGGSGIPYNCVEAYAWRSLAMYLASQRSAPVYLNWRGPAGRGSSGSSEQISSGGGISEYWLAKIPVSNADILLAQKRSRELLAEIDAKKAKK